MSGALISIIGPPAAGKTTTAEWLADEVAGRLILEDYAGNPFLARSYLGDSSCSLPAQLYFLFSRVRQLNLSAWPAEGLAVSDYGFCQDGVFARQNLSAEDLATYRRVAGPAASLVKGPDVLIHLDGDEQVLLERIGRRGREYERNFTAEFIAAMRGAYHQQAEQAACPVLAVDVGKVDLCDGQARSELLKAVKETLP